MKASYLTLLLALILVASAGAIAPVAAAPTAEQIYDRHIAAIGGQAKLDATNSLIIRGTYSEGGQSFDAALAKMRPFYKVVGDPNKLSMDFREGYDGSAWEFYGEPGIVLRTVGPAAAASRHGDYLFGPIIDYRAQGSALTLVGETKIAGRRAYQLRITMMDGFEQDEFIEPSSWLRVASRKVAKVHAFGADIASETHFSKYRRVNGVLMAFLDEEVEIATGKVLSTFETTEIVANQKIDLAAFSPPEFARTPVRNFIESIFVQRDDPKSVLWTQFDFRRAHPDIDTDKAAQVAGYHMLKMSAVTSAVALLEENARQYVKSSGAAFALGRAYRTAGDKGKARLEFERALKLDPDNKRTQAALKDLAP